jgi:hypothetical protein
MLVHLQGETAHLRRELRDAELRLEAAHKRAEALRDESLVAGASAKADRGAHTSPQHSTSPCG